MAHSKKQTAAKAAGKDAVPAKTGSQPVFTLDPDHYAIIKPKMEQLAAARQQVAAMERECVGMLSMAWPTFAKGDHLYENEVGAFFVLPARPVSGAVRAPKKSAKKTAKQAAAKVAKAS
jgi:hypothetical protein